MKKCYVCNNQLDGSKQEIISLREMPKVMNEGTFFIESFVIASFCKKCFFDNCDSKLRTIRDRSHLNCLYCQKIVDTNLKHFYVSWERSFDVITSELIDGKCYNENIGIYVKRKDWSQSIGISQNFSNLVFPAVKSLFPTLLAHELTSVQPMTLPSGLLNYFDSLVMASEIVGPDQLVMHPNELKKLTGILDEKKPK